MDRVTSDALADSIQAKQQIPSEHDSLAGRIAAGRFSARLELA